MRSQPRPRRIPRSSSNPRPRSGSGIGSRSTGWYARLRGTTTGFVGLQHAWGLIGQAELRTPPHWEVWRKSPPRAVEAAWVVTAALLDRLRLATESAGSRLVVFYVPEKISVFLGGWRDTRRRYGLSADEWDIRADEIRLLEICGGLQIECIDPTERFRAEGDRIGLGPLGLYWTEDIHWSRGGHRLAAQILAEHIANRTGVVEGAEG